MVRKIVILTAFFMMGSGVAKVSRLDANFFGSNTDANFNFDRNFFTQRSGLAKAGPGTYACERITGERHLFMASSAGRRINKYCGGNLMFTHVKPKNEDDYLVVCCTGKSVSRRKSRRRRRY